MKYDMGNRENQTTVYESTAEINDRMSRFVTDDIIGVPNLNSLSERPGPTEAYLGSI